MNIDISQISKVNGASLSLDMADTIEAFDKELDGVEITGPVALKGSLVNISGILRLQGRLELEYNSKCCRCLKDITSKMSADILEDFISRGEDSDSDSYTYEGNYISIDKAIMDNIVLNLPVRQLCVEQCKGLCRFCGKDLNIDACSCEEQTINPRMEALKDFFNT